MSALIAAVLLHAAIPAHAGHKSRHAAEPALGLREPPRSMSGISLDQAIEIAERQYNARVVKANEQNVNGRRVYVLRLLSEQGRVWTVRVDAETGGAR
jgi:uncharacterized membrane protein YkoI